jgi:hypothetical protein
MYGIDQELEGLKNTLGLLLEKKNRIQNALVIAYDEEKKFALQKQMDALEVEIFDTRKKLDSLSSPINTPDGMNDVKELIAKGRLEEALKLLAKLAPDNQVLQLQGQLSELQRKERLDLISYSEANQSRNRITNAALSLCDLYADTGRPVSGGPTSAVKQARQGEGAGKKIFFSYSKHDREYLDQLLRHLAGLRRQGKILPWSDHDILPGEEWDEEVKRQLAEADIILLLVSADFLATDYIWNVEITTAMERHERGEARVIPVVLRACEWSNLPFSKLNGLPGKANPVNSFPDRDAAWLEVVKGINRVVDDLNANLK